MKDWENFKNLWKHSPAAHVPTAFLVLPSFQFEPGFRLASTNEDPQFKEVIFLQEMLQEAWHYRQTNFTAYQPSDILVEFNTELVPWTGKFLVYGSALVSLSAIIWTSGQDLGLSSALPHKQVFRQTSCLEIMSISVSTNPHEYDGETHNHPV